MAERTLAHDKRNVTDPNGAPLIFFDGAANVGFDGETVNVTLAVRRHLLNEGKVDVDVVAVGFLRCTRVGAIGLRDAIDKALLISATPEGHAN